MIDDFAKVHPRGRLTGIREALVRKGRTGLRAEYEQQIVGAHP